MAQPLEQAPEALGVSRLPLSPWQVREAVRTAETGRQGCNSPDLEKYTSSEDWRVRRLFLLRSPGNKTHKDVSSLLCPGAS